LRNVLQITSKHYYFFILTLCLLLSSCVGIKQAGGSSSPSHKLYETFYLENGALQYFIKPQTLANDINNDHTVDFTLRKIKKEIENVVVNITVYTMKELTEKTDVRMKGNYIVSSGKDVSILFTEKKDDIFKNRISFTLPYQEFLTMIKENSFSFLLKPQSDITIKLDSTKKTEKNIEELKKSVAAKTDLMRISY